MPGLDVFNSDAFSVAALTAAINEVPDGQAVPTVIDALFEEEGITTTQVWIEKQNDTLSLVPAVPRGAPADTASLDRRNALSFATLHLPVRSAVMADEVQNLRAFGSESEVEQVQRRVNEKLSKMRRNIQSTITFHRMGAIKGQILDADGTTVLLDIYSAFGVTQPTQSMALTTSTTKVRKNALAAKRKAEKAIGNSAVITGWLALCGEGFFDELISHEDVKAAYDRWQDGDMLRNDPRDGFSFAGIRWREIYGKVGSVEFIGTDDAYLIPLGVPEMFITRYAPADYVETVNTLGLPFYAKQEPMPFGKGIELEAQSNPLNLCTRPAAVVKLTKV